MSVPHHNGDVRVARFQNTMDKCGQAVLGRAEDELATLVPRRAFLESRGERSPWTGNVAVFGMF